jgi:hypothetical protein
VSPFDGQHFVDARVRFAFVERSFPGDGCWNSRVGVIFRIKHAKV